MKPKQIPGFRVTFHDWVTIDPDTGKKTYMTQYERITWWQRFTDLVNYNRWWLILVNIVLLIILIISNLIQLFF